jgi:hypothetical protein
MATIDYDPGDFLFIDKDGQIVAVSGNSDFEDGDDDERETLDLDHPYLIVKVLEVQKVDGEGKLSRQYWDYSKEECPDCIVKE